MIMGISVPAAVLSATLRMGRPNALDPQEPSNLALAIAEMGLRYVVITSVDPR